VNSLKEKLAATMKSLDEMKKGSAAEGSEVRRLTDLARPGNVTGYSRLWCRCRQVHRVKNVSSLESAFLC
jgi:hypothetical protein